jgi:fused signal recognition particle receptor
MTFFERLQKGLTRSRSMLREQMNVILDRSPDLSDEYWDALEETLILGDMGAIAAEEIVEQLRETARRLALPDAFAVQEHLAEAIASMFEEQSSDLLDESPLVVLFVGINGAGKTTTVGKIANEGVRHGRRVLLGSGDTFRAAAIEQLHEWARRAQVAVVERDRGSDPASVCFEVIQRAEAEDDDLVLIDTAGRLHTSDDLMRELEKVVMVTRKRSAMPVKTLLVIDATTGQNGLTQAREFNRHLDLDGVIVTKLDGTAKGGIAVAISRELKLPIVRMGIGESIDDLRPFNPLEFAQALIGIN